MKSISIILLALLLFGCSAEKQFQKKVKSTQVFVYENPSYFSGVCAKLFPLIPTYIQGKDSIIERTVTIKGDSIPCPENQGKVIYVKCPDAKVVYRDIFRIDTVVNERTDRVDSLNRILTSTMAELRDYKQSNSKYIKQAQTRLFYVISLLILFVGSVFLLFKKW